MARPAVFLDRDGTLIREKVYLADPNGVSVVPGTLEALGALRDMGFVLVVVTNQSGIARGYYTLEDYEAVAARLDEILEAAGVAVDATYFCPHHPDDPTPCGCRKPAPGMYLSAAADLDLDVRSSYYLGDKRTDVLPALELGGRGILVRTGYGAEHEPELPPGIRVADDVLDAVEMIREDRYL